MNAIRTWMFPIALVKGALSLAQVVPFVSDLDRTMVFAGKRFTEADARPAQRMHALSDALLYVDHGGALCLYALEARSPVVLERSAVDELQVSGDRVAWRKADTLSILRGGRGQRIATGVQRFRVSDSLVVFIDSIEHELAVHWRGQRIVLATVQQGSEAPQWNQGSNTVTFYDRSRRSVFLFQQGVVRTLTNSTDVGIAVNGDDIVGYWDDVLDEFKGEAGAAPVRLSGMKPITAQAGNGIIAFLDGTVKLKAWKGSEVLQLTDSMPAQYWVKDRVLLYLWAGQLMCLTEAGPMAVEEYVPEHWQVSGDLLVYLDLDRRIRGIRGDGERVRFGNEAGIDGFQLFGDAVLYRSPAGPITIATERRSYIF
ncbi:MAG: hypothetical protein JNM62_14535 [Flavobacteriales bacterium]|nr:hypothetical protein [Flavobacteriales bacterium]